MFVSLCMIEICIRKSEKFSYIRRFKYHKKVKKMYLSLCTNQVVHASKNFYFSYLCPSLVNLKNGKFRPECDGVCDGKAPLLGGRVATALLYCKVTLLLQIFI